MTNFPIVNHRQRAVISAAIIFSIVPTAAVFLRVLARRIAARNLNLSDYCAIAAVVLAVALEAINITAVVHGGLAWGHASDIVAHFGSSSVVVLLKLIIPLHLLWALSLGFSKASILLLYSQLFNTDHYVIIAARATIGITVVWAMGTILAGCLVCQPLPILWNTVSGGHCGDQILSFVISGAINLATNVIVIVLPLPALLKLRMGKYKKVILASVFSLGILTCVTGVVRIVCLTQMDFTDIPYSMTLANIFGGLEASMAVTLACIPLFRPLVGRCKYRTGRDPGLRAPRREQIEPLGDDAGGDQLHLRPLSFKHQAEVSAVSTGNSSENRDVENPETKFSANFTPGIIVSREWEVTR
ncbi:hypothetical protein KVR01_010503 [Diaporthe batatas]|uniref:uncharacterized protein n=1 Tax=Diaporthe batatas TaxID=748121 RepID=UPI001D0474E3|nr:uncharacterized protein KVR01_010503 [Diaporthe batatas]KAG8159866.1 hypothetical protein KVR01_010503 [Diaporthe batatas]